MKEYIRLIEIQLPQDSKIVEALIASRNKKENIDNVEIYLYLGKGKKPLKMILRPKDESMDFDVVTPIDTEGKAHFYIGKAQISIPREDVFAKHLNKEHTDSTSLCSLDIEIAEELTNFTKSFTKKIRVLKDELGVAKETLRSTGDIFHILPNAKKRFNIVKNKINFEHFASPGIGSLNKKAKEENHYKEDEGEELIDLAIEILTEAKKDKERNLPKLIKLFERSKKLKDTKYDNKIVLLLSEILEKLIKERLSSQATKPCSSPFIFKDINKPFRFKFRFKDVNKDNVSASKAEETLVVPFSIVLKGIVTYSHLLSYINHYKATFRFKNKEFKGEIKSINIQDSSTTTANARYTSPSSVKAIVNIAITQECKDTIDNLKKELRSEEICVGSLGFDSITKSAGALYTIKSYAKKEDRQTINIDMSLNAVVELERFSQLVNKYSNLPFVVSTDPFVVSTSNEQAARIIYCADTKEEAVSLIMDIKEKLKNRFIENKAKQFNFSIYNNYINVEIKSFSSDNIILKVQDIVLVGSKDLGKYLVVAKLQ